MAESVTARASHSETVMASANLFAYVVFLQATEDTVLPISQGQYAHAAFLNLVAEADPPLATVLHDHKGRKPFTVSLLGGLGEGGDGLVPVRSGQQCWLRFTLLEPSLFRAFQRVLLGQGASLQIRIGPGVFRVLGAAGTQASHPWAGAIQSEDIATLPPLRDLTLQFAAPTAWSIGGDAARRMELLPHSSLLFGGLSSSWNAWCRQRMSQDIRAYAEQNVVPSWMKIETRRLWYGGRPQIGTVGTVTYTVLGSLEVPQARQIRTLAEFAFYAGVGYRTTMGMGQVRLLHAHH